MGYNYGAKAYQRVSDVIAFLLKSTLCINFIMWAFIMLFPQLLIQIFTSDSGLIELTPKCMRIYFGIFPMMSLQMTGQNTFVALNKPKFALTFSLLRKVILVAPLTLLLPRIGLGVEGVFWAEFASQAIGGTACFTTMYFTVWRHMRSKALQVQNGTES